MARSKQEREADHERSTCPSRFDQQQQLFAQSRQAVTDREAIEASEAAKAAEKAKIEEELKSSEKLRKEKEEKDFFALKKANERRAKMDRLSDENHKATVAAEAKEAREKYQKKEEMWAKSQRESIEEQRAKVRRFQEEKAAKERVEREIQRAKDEEAAALKEMARRAALTEEERVQEDKEAAELLASIDNDSLFGDDDYDNNIEQSSSTEQSGLHDESSSGDPMDDMNSLFGDDSSYETGGSSASEMTGDIEETENQHQRDATTPTLPQPSEATLSSSANPNISYEEVDIEALLAADLDAEMAAEQQSTELASSKSCVNVEVAETTVKQANAAPSLKLGQVQKHKSMDFQTSVDAPRRRQEATISETAANTLQPMDPFPAAAPVPTLPAPTGSSQLPRVMNLLAKDQIYNFPDGRSLTGTDLLKFTPEQRTEYRTQLRVSHIRLTRDGKTAIFSLVYNNQSQQAVSMPSGAWLTQPSQNYHQQLPPSRPQASQMQSSHAWQQHPPASNHPFIPPQPFVPGIGYQNQCPPSLAPTQLQGIYQEFQNPRVPYDRATSERAAHEQRQQQYHMQLHASQFRQPPATIDPSIIGLMGDSNPRVSQSFGNPHHPGEVNQMARQEGNCQYPAASSFQNMHGPTHQSMMQPAFQPHLPTTQPYLSAYPPPTSQTINGQVGPFMQQQHTY